MVRRAIVFSGCLLPLLAACSGSSSSDSGTNPDGGGNPGNDGGGGGPDGGGGGPDGGGGGPDGGSCGPSSYTFSGRIGYVRERIGPTTGESATAYFLTAPQTETGSACGTCTFIPLPFDGGTDAGTYEAAGNLTLLNLRTNDGGAMIQTASPVEYVTFTVPWVGGDSLKMTGTGGAFPAFSVTLQQPDALTGLTPSPFGAAVNVSRSTAMTATWTPSASPAGVGMIFSLSTDAGVILCLSPDSAGSVTVPTSALGNFASGTKGSILYQRELSTLDTSTGQGILQSGAILNAGSINVTP